MTKYLWQVGGLYIGHPIFIKTTELEKIERNWIKAGQPIKCGMCKQEKIKFQKPVGMQPYESEEEALRELPAVCEVYCVKKDACKLVSIKGSEVEIVHSTPKKKRGRPKKKDK